MGKNQATQKEADELVQQFLNGVMEILGKANKTNEQTVINLIEKIFGK